MDFALFVLRLVAGGFFAAHGAQKLWGAFGGAGIDGTAAFFEKVGLKPGRLHAKAAGSAEFAAGVLFVLGFLTPVAALLLISVMTAAIWTVHGPKGPWATDGGYEYNAVLIAVAFALAGVGAGSWSLDRAFALDLAGAGWAIFALVVGVAGGVGAVLSGRAEAQRRVDRAGPAAAH